MPWLNWLLKLHIRLRTISLLISTHNTQVYVQWMPYSFVWLYLIKLCFHMLNLCWFKHKKIFECFRCFWKVFWFYKKLKISKTVLPCFWGLSCGSSKSHAIVASSRVDFGDLFASGRSSHEGYTEIFAAQLVTPSRVRLPVAKNT